MSTILTYLGVLALVALGSIIITIGGVAYVAAWTLFMNGVFGDVLYDAGIY